MTKDTSAGTASESRTAGRRSAWRVTSNEKRYLNKFLVLAVHLSASLPPRFRPPLSISLIYIVTTRYFLHRLEQKTVMSSENKGKHISSTLRIPAILPFTAT
ncbi:hypothetical protein E2C01_039727 [Portunus trituberculatus]|uniref:Uncharacterized protein n=1 Tax=Portunus trituberculatus TaxID=210409 RepID=A0A5B7FLH8_PORTR|nr:hypothetical protein [Portunus trituberculatus]